VIQLHAEIRRVRHKKQGNGLRLPPSFPSCTWERTRLAQVRAWLDDDIIEDELEFTPEFEGAIQQSERDMAESRPSQMRRGNKG
jgi:hypothetical protein